MSLLAWPEDVLRRLWRWPKSQGMRFWVRAVWSLGGRRKVLDWLWRVMSLHWEDAKHWEMFHFDVSCKGRKDGMLQFLERAHSKLRGYTWLRRQRWLQRLVNEHFDQAQGDDEENQTDLLFEKNLGTSVWFSRVESAGRFGTLPPNFSKTASAFKHFCLFWQAFQQGMLQWGKH